MMSLKSIPILIKLSIASICCSSVIATENFSTQSELVDVGGYQLNFNITRACGCAPTIIFEAGGGCDSSVWLNLSKAVSSQTGATTIAYDRSGFGKSQSNPAPYSIVKEVEALEQGLKQLKIDGQLVLVAHSYGGFLATLFAARNPERVDGIVLIDANLASFLTDARVDQLMKDFAKNREAIQSTSPNLMRVLDAFDKTVLTMRKVSLPTTIPVIDIVAEYPPMEAAEERAAWKRVHEEFVKSAANRKLVMAIGSSHFVMADKPELVTSKIVSMVSQVRSNSTIGGQASEKEESVGMKKIQIDQAEKKIVGIKTRTNNPLETNSLEGRIFPLVKHYFQQNIAASIPNRTHPGTTFCIYTDYESDHQGDYTYFIGEEVSSFDGIPNDLKTLVIPPQKYIKFTHGPGSMPDVVRKPWQQIWQMTPAELGGMRSYISDFEIYDERSRDHQNIVLDIYIGIK